ncbi:MAG: hypothetical protein AAF478_04735 [Pseudomonadota bacterium]
MLYNSSLKGPQIKKIGDIFVAIAKDRQQKSRIKRRLKERLSDFGILDIFNEKKIDRIFGGTIPQQGDQASFLFDFLVVDVLNYVRMSSIDAELRIELEDGIHDLIANYRDALKENQNPFVTLANDIDLGNLGTGVPKEFCNRFIGYRRSSIHGDVVRFYIKISSPTHANFPFVRYTNRYQRGNNSWLVSGGGVYTKDNVLYLFGHAREKDSGQSLGYRVLALQRIGTTKNLCGPLISMDSNGPIAARVLLLPLEDHDLTVEQKNMSERKLIEWMVSREAAENNDRYLDEIKANVASCFDSKNHQDLFYYISNATRTTLRGVPEPDEPLIKAETELRRICSANKMDFSERFLTLIREGTIPRGS